MAALDMLRRNISAVAFANSVRDACPACAQAPGAADDRRRNRTISPAFHSIHLIRRSADRPLRSPCFGKRGERVWGAWGISRPGERRPANRRPSASGTGRNAILAPGRRWIRHGGARRPPRRTRRGSFPRSPRVVHRERPPEPFAHAGFPGRETPSPPLPCCTSRNFREKRVSPSAAIGFIMGPSRSRSAPSRPARVRRDRPPIPLAESLQTRVARIASTWNFPTGSPPIARPR